MEKNELIVIKGEVTTEVIDSEVIEAEIIEEGSEQNTMLPERLSKLGYKKIVLAVPVLPEDENVLFGLCDSLGLHKPRDYYVENVLINIRTFNGFRIVRKVFAFKKIELNLIESLIRDRFLTCFFELVSDNDVIKLDDTREVHNLLKTFIK